MSNRLLSRYHYIQPARELTEAEAGALYDAGRLPSPSEAEDAAGELLLWALEHGHPVTIGFWQEYKRKDPDGKIRVVKGPDKQPLLVHTVRTYELFNMEENKQTGAIRFEAMDRLPTKSDDRTKKDKPAIRSVVASRVTDITIHHARHRLKNTYFISKVKENVTGAAALTDDTVWHIIRKATSRKHAEELATAALSDAR